MGNSNSALDRHDWFEIDSVSISHKTEQALKDGIPFLLVFNLERYVTESEFNTDGREEYERLLREVFSRGGYQISKNELGAYFTEKSLIKGRTKICHFIRDTWNNPDTPLNDKILVLKLQMSNEQHDYYKFSISWDEDKETWTQKYIKDINKDTARRRGIAALRHH